MFEMAVAATAVTLRHTTMLQLLRAVRVLWLASVIAVANTGVDAAPALQLTDQRILVLGDSITQNGRYVDFIEYYLHRLSPTASRDIISIGLSSETVSGLSEASHPFPRPCILERADRALKAVKPTVVLACYGMNDGIYHPSAPERIAAFGEGVNALVSAVRASGARLVLITPPVFDVLPIRSRAVPLTSPEFGYGKPFEGYDAVLAEFAEAAQAFASTDVLVVDLHRTMLDEIASRRERDATFTFTPDGVHPGDAGHLLIARTILVELGYELPDGTDESHLSRILADPVFALIRDRRQLRSEAWLPFVGYRRGESFRSASVEAAENVAARLEREISVLDAR